MGEFLSFLIQRFHLIDGLRLLGLKYRFGIILFGIILFYNICFVGANFIKIQLKKSEGKSEGIYNILLK